MNHTQPHPAAKRSDRLNVQQIVLNFLVPQATMIWHHPLYHLERRRQRGGRSLATLPRYSVTRLGVICGVLTTVWLILFVESNDAQDYVTNHALDTGAQLLKWLLFLGLGASVLLDFSGVGASLGSVNRDRPTVNWSLLRLTPLARSQVIMVKQVIAQTRIWRMVIVILGLRAGTVAVALLHFVGTYIWFDGTASLMREIHNHPFEAFSTLYAMTVIFAVYITEPLWRVRVSVAIGTLVSARVQNVSMSILAGLAGLGLMWLTQAILIAFLVGLSIRVANGVDPYNDFDVLMSINGLFTLYATAIYAYYNRLRAWCLFQAARDAFRE